MSHTVNTEHAVVLIGNALALVHMTNGKEDTEGVDLLPGQRTDAVEAVYPYQALAKAVDDLARAEAELRSQMNACAGWAEVQP